jgi:hypothetical protein
VPGLIRRHPLIEEILDGHSVIAATTPRLPGVQLRPGARAGPADDDDKLTMAAAVHDRGVPRPPRARAGGARRRRSPSPRGTRAG